MPTSTYPHHENEGLSPTLLSLQTEQVRLEAQDAMGWVSPEYGLSRSVNLQPAVLQENRCVAFDSTGAEMEAYRILRAQIMLRSKPDSGNTLMITSAVAGEGKTLTAVNLAMTFALEFSQTVLLVDCDLRRQNIHNVLGYHGTLGLGNYFIDKEPLQNLFVWPGVEKLTVISGGRTITGSSELLGSPGMKDLVNDLKTRYRERLIIFDVPPVLASADALAFAPLVDNILVVTRAGLTSVKDVQKALRMLPREKVLGTVLNGGCVTTG